MTEDGSVVVLKLIVPRAGRRARPPARIDALRLADGDGVRAAPRCAVGALLLERLGRSLFDIGLPMAAPGDPLRLAAPRLAAGRGLGLPTGAEKGRWLDRVHHRGCGSGWTGRARSAPSQHALACAERRVAAHDDERAVLVHGDVHQWNALEAATASSWSIPTGCSRSPSTTSASSCARILRALRATRASGRDGSPRAAACEEDAIWEWGVVERVSTGLLATPDEMRRSAARCSPPPTGAGGPSPATSGRAAESGDDRLDRGEPLVRRVAVQAVPAVDADHVTGRREAAPRGPRGRPRPAPTRRREATGRQGPRGHGRGARRRRCGPAWRCGGPRRAASARSQRANGAGSISAMPCTAQWTSSSSHRGHSRRTRAATAGRSERTASTWATMPSASVRHASGARGDGGSSRMTVPAHPGSASSRPRAVTVPRLWPMRTSGRSG